MDRMGYFKVINDGGGVYLSLVPKQGNGKITGLDVLMAYLDKKGVNYGTVPELKKSLETLLTTGKKVKISDAGILPFAGWCEYQNKNNMELYATMYPPVEGVQKISSNEILSDLKNMRVVYGIDTAEIERLVKEERYFETVLIAKATKAVEGHDAILKYNFNTEIKAKPTIKEDGTVDFHQLDMINHIKEGDIVAEIIPEDVGRDGKDILGMPIKPNKVAKKVFKFGRNLEVTDNGTKLVSKVTGHVSLEGDKIFVSDEYVVGTDVDTSTGDIVYDGNVKIVGCVRAGFKVCATGNVNVNGAVEGAVIEAGGDIVLQKGILGMNKGVLKAGGNIIATFIENASVTASKNLEADALLHSKITVDGTITVHGKNGYIIGGEVRAGSLIEAKNIGSTMGTNTVVTVGTNPELMDKINTAKNNIISLTQDRAKLSQIVELLKKKLETDGKLDAVKMEYLQKSAKNLLLITEQLEENKKLYSEMSSKVCEDKDARIKVKGSIFQGVKLEFGDQTMFIRDKNDFCQYVKKGADIVKINL